MMPKDITTPTLEKVEVVQIHYRTCRHTQISPQPAIGQRYRIVAFLDEGSRCPTCREEYLATRQRNRKAAKNG